MKNKKEVPQKAFFCPMTYVGIILSRGFRTRRVVYRFLTASSILFGLTTWGLCVESQAPNSPGKDVHAEESNWDKAKRDTGEATSSIGEATKETADKVWKKTTVTSKKAWNSTRRTSKKAWKLMKKTLSDAGGSIKKGFGDAADAIEGK